MKSMKRMVFFSCLFHLTFFLVVTTVRIPVSPLFPPLPDHMVSLVSLPPEAEGLTESLPESFPSPKDSVPAAQTQAPGLKEWWKSHLRSVKIPEAPPAEPSPPPKAHPQRPSGSPDRTLSDWWKEKKKDLSSSFSPIVKGSLSVDSPHFAFPEYLAAIEREVSKRWVLPTLDSRERMTAVIGFRLLSTGHVTGITVEKRSGNRYFDESALRAVKMSSPLPSFPEGAREESLTIHFSFTVQEPS